MEAARKFVLPPESEQSGAPVENPVSVLAPLTDWTLQNGEWMPPATTDHFSHQIRSENLRNRQKCLTHT